MPTPSPKLPMELSAKFTMRDRTLIMVSNGAVFQTQLAVEAAEWIWVDVLGGGDRRDAREILEAKASVTDKGLTIRIRTFEIFRTMDASRRGVLVEKQSLLNAGQAPGMWKVVQL